MELTAWKSVEEHESDVVERGQDVRSSGVELTRLPARETVVTDAGNGMSNDSNGRGAASVTSAMESIISRYDFRTHEFRL